jgi:hypothetical protein
MPLLDYFEPPLREACGWESFHFAWPVTITEQLNRDVLPPAYHALPLRRFSGSVEIDVAALGAVGSSATAAGWAPPAPALAAEVDFIGVDDVEVRVVYDNGEMRLTSAIEIVSPANKDRAGKRRAFVVKCAALLRRGVSLVVVDVVAG